MTSKIQMIFPFLEKYFPVRYIKVYSHHRDHRCKMTLQKAVYNIFSRSKLTKWSAYWRINALDFEWLIIPSTRNTSSTSKHIKISLNKYLMCRSCQSVDWVTCQSVSKCQSETLYLCSQRCWSCILHPASDLSGF